MTACVDNTTAIHPSLIRPILLAGADRNLVMINMTCVATLIFGVGIHWMTLFLALTFALVGHFALVKLAKFDPLFLPLYLRHIRYRDFYLAKGFIHSRCQL